jgi:outer membrane protein OmpA-like peptidoglycan-associated protein
MEHRLKTLFFCSLLTIAGCAPMSEADPPTGNLLGTTIGGVGGASVAAILGASKPTIAVAGIAGAGLGYYMSTLRFSGSGIIAAGGKVYAIGDYLVIDIPTDAVFDPNTAEFLPAADPVLESLVSVLNRYSGHNIFISGNTSGSWTERFERKMSECRASQIASYLWAHGITNSPRLNTDSLVPPKSQHFIYVGYGDNFPIGNKFHLKGIRANSRIQIVASPSQAALHWDQQHNNFKKFDNVGDSSAENAPSAEAVDNYAKYAYAFSDDHMSEGTNLSVSQQSGSVQDSFPTIKGDAPGSVKDSYAENGSNYNIVQSESQTNVGVSAPKQAGYKGEDFKSEDKLPA